MRSSVKWVWRLTLVSVACLGMGLYGLSGCHEQTSISREVPSTETRRTTPLEELPGEDYADVIPRAVTPETENSMEEDPQVTEPEDTDWMLMLVNPQNTLPEDFSVTLKELENHQAVDARIYEDLQTMLEDARKEGLSPVVRSSYRTQADQEILYANKVSRLRKQGYSREEAEAEAARWVAFPGTSEHQLGLAVDIVAESYRALEEDQENTPEQKWLMANAHRYGFILRYPEEKSQITGIGYEPWHYRYVGREAAGEIYEKGICLEEYLERS